MPDTKISALASDAALGGAEQVPVNDAGTNKRTTTADIAALAKGLPLGLTGATSATRYVGATASGAPASGTFAVGDFVITHAGQVYVCTTAGTPGTWTQIGGGGGSGIPASTVDAKGDLLVGTADDTVTRLAVGSDGHVLTADSTVASGVKWAAASGGGSSSITDSFTRANSTTSLGDTTTGQVWTAHTGGWGISSNQGYQSTPTNDAMATVESHSLSNCTISADITSGALGYLGGLLFRYLNVNNCWVARLNTNAGSNALELYRRSGGTWTLVGSWSPAGLAASTTYALSVVLLGSSITVKLNGTTRITATNSQEADATRHGLYGHAVSNSGAMRWDNFSIAA